MTSRRENSSGNSRLYLGVSNVLQPWGTQFFFHRFGCGEIACVIASVSVAQEKGFQSYEAEPSTAPPPLLPIVSSSFLSPRFSPHGNPIVFRRC